VSLDVYLYGAADQTRCVCPKCGDDHAAVNEPQLFSANITHNLNTMAGEAGIYEHLWRPDKIGVTTAGQLIEPLRAGLQRLRERPEYFKRFNPANGCGTYEGLVRFVTDYADACEDNPEATVTVSR